ncbi:MAG: hypothetical protein IPL28_26085 [Chloroflexi bacterium]|nr:hypothetical protein [Chloroflexota bacterium]
MLGQWFVQEAETWGYHVQQVHLGGEREPQRWITEWRKFAQRYYYDGANVVALSHINELDTVWAEPLAKFAVEMTNDLPLLLLIPLNVPVPLQTIPEINPWHGLAQDLVTRELAHEIHLQAVTRADIAELMEPANPLLPPLLHDLCRGQPRLARDVWQMWQEAGLVWQDREGMWQADTQQHDWQAQLQQGWAHLVRDHLVALLGKQNPWLPRRKRC